MREFGENLQSFMKFKKKLNSQKSRQIGKLKEKLKQMRKIKWNRKTCKLSEFPHLPRSNLSKTEKIN